MIIDVLLVTPYIAIAACATLAVCVVASFARPDAPRAGGFGGTARMAGRSGGSAMRPIRIPVGRAIDTRSMSRYR